MSLIIFKESLASLLSPPVLSSIKGFKNSVFFFQFRDLTVELVDVSNGNKTLHEEIKSLNMKNEALICEDEIRTKDYEYLLKNCNELEKQYSEISKKLKKAENELHEKDTLLHELQEREKRNCTKLNELKKDNEKYNDEINNLEIKYRQLKDREWRDCSPFPRTVRLPFPRVCAMIEAISRSAILHTHHYLRGRI